MDLAALIRRIIYPRTDTPEQAWEAAGNSWMAGAILALSRLLFGTVWLAAPQQPIGPGLAFVGMGFFYILLSMLAFRRSRLAAGAILVLAVLEMVIEVVLKAEYGYSFGIAAAALILAVGGFRGANAVFAHYRNSRS